MPFECSKKLLRDRRLCDVESDFLSLTLLLDGSKISVIYPITLMSGRLHTMGSFLFFCGSCLSIVTHFSLSTDTILSPSDESSNPLIAYLSVSLGPILISGRTTGSSYNTYRFRYRKLLYDLFFEDSMTRDRFTSGLSFEGLLTCIRYSVWSRLSFYIFRKTKSFQFVLEIG